MKIPPIANQLFLPLTVVLISFKPPGWHLLGRRGQSEGSGAQVTKISKSVKRSILVSGFSGKWSLTEKASGGSQCWAQTIHTQLRLHLALRLHKRCPGSGDGDSHWRTHFLFQATQVLYQHHPPQLCEHSGDGGGAFDRLLCWGFLSSYSRVPGGSRHLRRAPHMRWR